MSCPEHPQWVHDREDCPMCAAFAHVALDEIGRRLKTYEAENIELRAALTVILTAVRGDEKGEHWSLRKWLDKRGIFNDDLGKTERLIEAVCAAALRVQV